MTMRPVVRKISGLLAIALLLILAAGSALAQLQAIPPKPDRYITDTAGVLDAGTLDSINRQLDQFERDTSNQFVVYIFDSLPTDAEIAPYTTDLYNAWQLGQKGKDNGVLLVVSVKDRKMFIGTNRGLNGTLTDALCKRIVTQVIAPHFGQKDYAGGIQAGVDAVIAASKGEFKGDGRTADDRNRGNQQDTQGIPAWVIILVIIIFIIIMSRRGGGGGFGSSSPMVITNSGWGGNDFGSSGGWSSGGGGGGGFSGGGGGSSDGGGAGGSW